jgi:tetratricopeptide (TPR) repeat protein
MNERIMNYLLEQMNSAESFSEHEQKRDQVLNMVEKYDILDRGTKKKVNCFSFQQKIILVAGFVLVIGLSIVFNEKYSTLSGDNIFASYYQPFKTPKISHVRVFYSNNKLDRALQFYNNGNYQNAILELKMLIKSDTANSSVHFLLGISLIENGEYQGAIKNLIYVVDQNDNFSLIEPAEWYLALCYLKTKQKEDAISLFNDLANKYYYQNKAEDILKKIK